MGSGPNPYDLLRQELAGTNAEVLTPDSPGYKDSLKRWSEHCVKPAAAVIYATSATEISTILKFTAQHSISLTVKGGGHSTSGSSSISNGLVIDLSKMRRVTVDPAAKTITAQGGTIWEDVDVEAAKYGLATVGGTVNHTGVGGLTLGGGYGYLTARYGLTIDVLLAVEMVLADGTIVTASESENADLFWAVRGAGQNFGVVSSFVFRGFEQKDRVFSGLLVFPPEKLGKVVEFANEFHEVNDGDQTLLWGFSSPPPMNAPVVLCNVFYNGPEEKGRAFFQPLVDLEPLVNTCGMIPYEKLNTQLNASAGFEGRKSFGGGAFALPLEIDFVTALHKEFVGFVEKHERMGESMLLFETIPYKKVLERENEEMAFSNRGEYYNIATVFKWFDPALDEEVRDFSRGLLKRASEGSGIEQDEKVRSSRGVGTYGNYADTDVAATAIYGNNAKRLEELKRKYDPGNVFDKGTRLVSRPIFVVNN